jgi:hypothetical protein
MQGGEMVGAIQPMYNVILLRIVTVKPPVQKYKERRKGAFIAILKI